MQRLQNTSKRVIAALMFFTRLPLLRVVEVEKKYFDGLVPLWPLAGWLTGGMMAFVAWSSMRVGLPVSVSVLLAVVSRVLLTGALHEDGFADFCDGFGGGTTKDRVLAIMKDSHIGTYGVIALILYALLFCSCLIAILERGWSPLLIVVVDSLSKWISSTIVYFLPYARREGGAKNGLDYASTPFEERLLSFGLAIVPLVLFTACAVDGMPSVASFLSALLCPAAGAAALFFFMHRRIGGYTGDCCGATFIITEMLFYLSLCVVLFS